MGFELYPVYTIQPVVKPVEQPVVSCKRGLSVDRRARDQLLPSRAYYGLRGSISPVLVATGFVKRKWQVSPPIQTGVYPLYPGGMKGFIPTKLSCIVPQRVRTASATSPQMAKYISKLDGCIVRIAHNTVFGSKRSAI